jgi:hypothetical protein
MKGGYLNMTMRKGGTRGFYASVIFQVPSPEVVIHSTSYVMRAINENCVIFHVVCTGSKVIYTAFGGSMQVCARGWTDAQVEGEGADQIVSITPHSGKRFLA